LLTVIPTANEYIDQQAYGDLEDDDIETDPAEILGSSYGHPPQYQYDGNRSYIHSYPSTSYSHRSHANVPPVGAHIISFNVIPVTNIPGSSMAAFGAPQHPSNTSPLFSPSPAPQGRGANPRNSHGIQLKPVSVLRESLWNPRKICIKIYYLISKHLSQLLQV
jgi:hypothetical protein